MKKTLLLLLSLITFSACEQSKNEKLKENHDLFILLKNKNNISLNQFRDNKIVEIEKYKISKNSIYKTGEIYKKSHTSHGNKTNVGEQWKIWPKGTKEKDMGSNSKSSGTRTTVDGEGNIIGN